MKPGAAGRRLTDLAEAIGAASMVAGDLSYSVLLDRKQRDMVKKAAAILVKLHLAINVARNEAHKKRCKTCNPTYRPTYRKETA